MKVTLSSAKGSDQLRGYNGDCNLQACKEAKPPAGLFYSSSRNTRDFNHEICAQSETRLHREYNLAMKNKSLRRIADVRSGRR